MLNFKAGGIAAGAAFVLSLLIGLVSGTGFLVLLLRALFFGALFFGLSCLVSWLLGQYVPELLNGAEDDPGMSGPGSIVNIREGPVVGAFPQDSSDVVDDIGGRPSARARQNPGNIPLDQEEKVDYTDTQDISDGLGNFSSGGFAGSSSGPEAFPDMDGLSETFTPQPEGFDAGAVSFDTPEPRRPHSSLGSKTTLKGDFNPKELAQAIQTVLKKDEKG
ncbi:MAG: hypothetical protein LBK77_08870 [Spirochaetaceae bacterium]|nr:hypothetical protein [Spirochaetaceae bacterium]